MGRGTGKNGEREAEKGRPAGEVKGRKEGRQGGRKGTYADTNEIRTKRDKSPCPKSTAFKKTN